MTMQTVSFDRVIAVCLAASFFGLFVILGFNEPVAEACKQSTFQDGIAYVFCAGWIVFTGSAIVRLFIRPS